MSNATGALNALITHLVDKGTARGISWATDLNSARNKARTQTLKSWFANHDVVETIQVRWDGERLSNGWVPGPREVDRSRASYVLLDGSRRDYAGITCVTSSASVWVGWDDDMQTLVCYSVI